MSNDDHANLDKPEPSKLPTPSEDQETERVDKRRIGKLIGGSIIGLTLLGVVAYLAMPLIWTLVAASQFLFPERISQEDRYYHINQVLEQIDYKTAGTVLEENYDDNSPHPLNPAYFTVVLEGENTYKILKERLELVDPTPRCDEVESETVLQLTCDFGRPRMARVVQSEAGLVTLQLTDTGTGR